MFRRLVLAGAGTALIAAAFAFAMTASQWQTANAAITNCSTSGQALDGEEQLMLTLINQKRAAASIPALKASPNLSRAAAWKSGDSSATGAGFSHTDSLGRGVPTRVSQCGYGMMSSAEDIAYGYGGAAATLNAFLNSPLGHACPIDGSQPAGAPTCNPATPRNFTVIGIGHVGSAWTLNFGSLDDSNQPWDSGTPSSPSATATTSPTAPANTPTSAAGGSTAAANTPLPTSTPKPAAPALPLKRAVLPLVSAE